MPRFPYVFFLTSFLKRAALKAAALKTIQNPPAGPALRTRDAPEGIICSSYNSACAVHPVQHLRCCRAMIDKIDLPETNQMEEEIALRIWS
jgi:hypothetical protein